ncbi:MAG: diphosphomevalonate decarboxylase [Gammaproteobacteria bacterium]|nr:diphosphomevalonate decarboxylase [Gammaproteobacteria bacterium]MDH3505670.1 diphosphomevalonate decarboxylase [Gammaproteobacteria bacterium]
MQARARARANIALVKYWGKSDAALNIPAVGSISITLDGLWSDTEIEFDSKLTHDSLLLDGKEDATQLRRVTTCLDLLRREADVEMPARVVSHNNFPTGAGLASSASGFAALVGAATAALGLERSPTELSILARRGSGSAARSVFGGFVEMHVGEASDGNDSYATPLLAADDWPLHVVIAVTETGAKATSSTKGMQSSEATSPFYRAWVESSPADLDAARSAIVSHDFDKLGEVAEHSCMKLHALAMTSRPPILYWNPATLACIDAVRALRRSGVPVFFTIDAGPQLKAVCLPEATDRVAAELHDVSGVVDVLVTGLGPGLEMG